MILFGQNHNPVSLQYFDWYICEKFYMTFQHASAWIYFIKNLLWEEEKVVEKEEGKEGNL